MDLKIGDFNKFGAVYNNGSVTFTFSVDAQCSKAAVILYAKNTYKLISKIELDDSYRIGDVYSVLVTGIDIDNTCYLYMADDIEFMDPYAYGICGREKWADEKRAGNEYKVYAGFTDLFIPWEDTKVKIKPEDMIIYKLHMRGFTMQQGLGKTTAGNYHGLITRLPYLKELGVTSIEIMPIYDFEEMFLSNSSKYDNKGNLINSIVYDNKINYWGYGDANYMAPKASYFPGNNPTVGLRELVGAIHSNGMELIMELSFLETATKEYIVDVLKYYMFHFHIDGFHIIGATIPISHILEDPFLTDTKLFFENVGDDRLYSLKGKKHVFLYNDSFQCVLRQMLNHMNGSMVQFANHTRRQNDMFGFVNFAANTTGFTLLDSFSYGEKHNEANGEDNRDGTNNNYSLNYGYEGKTNNKAINQIRSLQSRNAITATLLSIAVPLINAGDEIGNTTGGNNNPYCQDNKIGWTVFSKAKDKELLLDYTKRLIEFRKAHKCLHPDNAMKMNDYKHVGFPDMSYHGSEPWMMSVSEGQKALGVLYCGAYSNEEDDIYVCYNFGYDAVTMALPRLKPGKRWRQLLNTKEYSMEYDWNLKVINNQQDIEVPGSSITILLGVKP